MKLPREDLDLIFSETKNLWQPLRNKKIFITGGTGFFGHWLLESFCDACSRLELGAQAVVLTRSPEAFQKKSPHLASHPSIILHEGDVRSFDFPQGAFDALIHGAVDARQTLIDKQPLLVMETILEGTRRVLDFSLACGVKRFLFLSSGGVYGKQPPEIPLLIEETSSASHLTEPLSSYAKAKKEAELLVSLSGKKNSIHTKIARGFAFIGPHLPTDAHYAVGNFLSSALRSRPIEIKGDGTSLRSYLYGADLAIWLWTILLKDSQFSLYNVGSEKTLSIKNLALKIVQTLKIDVPIQINKQPNTELPPSRYLPSTARARNELGLFEHTSLEQAIIKTAAFLNEHKK